jgi:protein-S-isoprenylcysteine O-methyltransferase Ste14
MKVSDMMVKQGNWLFRYRSYLPLILMAFAISCMWFYKANYTTETTLYDLFCFLLALGGEAVRITAVGFAADGTSGRNTKRQIADEINQTGIYSLFRHPLYLGNFIIWLSIALLTRIWWLVIIFTALYWLYYERIILAEENFLEEKFGDDFSSFAGRVNVLIPRINGYIPNKYVFRPCRVLRKENSTVYGIIVVFTLFELLRNFFAEKLVFLQAHWVIILVLFSIAYFVLRILKSYTDLLLTEVQEEKVKHGE